MSARRAAYGDTLSLRYALRLRDGTEIVSNLDDADADTLTLGDGTLAQSIEQWLIGLAVGERHVFLLEARQAFGVRQPELIQLMPRQDVLNTVQLAPGTLVEFAMPSGQMMAGQILEVLDDTVKVDFNHPLADLPIEFEVEITELLDPKPV